MSWCVVCVCVYWRTSPRSRKRRPALQRESRETPSKTGENAETQTSEGSSKEKEREREEGKTTEVQLIGLQAKSFRWLIVFCFFPIGGCCCCVFFQAD